MPRLRRVDCSVPGIARRRHGRGFRYLGEDGRPIDVDVSDEVITVPERLTTRGENYVLKVRGDSMIDDGIMDGDYIIVAHRREADNGQMVVANVSGEVTLKRFYKEGERVRLQPANSMMGPIYASARDVMVQGVVVGLMRRF